MSNDTPGVVTIDNVEDFIGKRVDCKRRLFHHYPLTFNKVGDNYFYIDCNAVAVHFNKGDSVRYDSVTGLSQENEQKQGGAKFMNNHNPDNKPIHFIDSHYNELFTIPDGGYIDITKSDGEVLTRQCKYHGETHIDLGTHYFQLYHICQFAEMMESNGSTCAPNTGREVVDGGYTITDRHRVGDKVFIIAYNPEAEHKFMTARSFSDRSNDYDTGRFFNGHADAWTDYFRRADAERSGRTYNPPTPNKNKKNRDDAR